MTRENNIKNWPSLEDLNFKVNGQSFLFALWFGLPPVVIAGLCFLPPCIQAYVTSEHSSSGLMMLPLLGFLLISDAMDLECFFPQVDKIFFFICVDV